MLAYWRDALLDVTTADRAPRQLAVFDWLLANIPASAEEPQALCMGDARLVNSVIAGSDVRALIDFEVAYVGNPAGDVGYSLFLDRSQDGRRRTVARHPVGSGDVGALERGDRARAGRRRLLERVRRRRHRRHRHAGHGAMGSVRSVRRGGQHVGPRMGVARRPGGTMTAVDPSLGEPMVGPADEQVHRSDPDVWSWNESWFFSWIDLDGGPVGFFRLGLLPNQGRAMVWCYVHRDGEWIGVDETRLRYEDFDLTDGFAYDQWGLQLAWRPGALAATFSFAGVVRTITGPDAGAFVPLSVDLAGDADHRSVRHRYRHRPRERGVPGEPLRADAHGRGHGRVRHHHTQRGQHAGAR